MMKKAILLCTMTLCFMFSTFLNAQQGHFKIRNDEFIQIGYDNYKTLTFGTGISTPNNGRWGIEHWNGGLNIWKPWPGTSYGNYKLFINYENDFVGIGKFPSHRLDVNGDIATYGTVKVTSDARLKTNIINLSSSTCLTRLMNVQSVTYNYKYDNFPSQAPTPNEDELTEVKRKTMEAQGEDNGEVQSQIIRYGFLAQDLKNVFPDLVSEDDGGFYSVDYMGMIPILVEAIKEQQVKIEKLEAELAELKK